jgi:hypothetical protein
MRKFIGSVTKKAFGTGSKSEHNAVFLETEAGEFVLRRQGGNPFSDVELDNLVGKTISCRGEVRDYTLTMADWTECSADDLAHRR